MSIANLILPHNASPKRMVEGYLFCAYLFFYSIVDAYCTRKIGFKISVGAEEWIYDRDKNPRAYWLCMAVYLILFLSVNCLLLNQLPA
jgi:hypothetical protein